MRDPIFAHLPSGAREIADWAKGESPSTAEAMYPRPQTKPPSNNPYRESLLRGLRELNARLDTRRR